ncbi:TonB family protein [Rubrolithibacter danxiaensis]|uniref:TonB family protein n=1 Tax=Rubrolithibacter danxiaensis TaxID=3390805 RepID=UPI003BF8327A
MIYRLLSLLIFSSLLSSALAQPTFKGGPVYLNSFIVNNQIYPEYSKSNCLQGTIDVEFKLNHSGRIYFSRVKRGFGTDLDIEALRIVRLTSGKWIVPADHDTTVAIVLPVNFTLKEYNCENQSKDNISAAIAAYKARQDLTNAVLNYYDKKSQGKVDPGQEVEIENLKQQLGYNEKFITRKLRQAQQKLKQGDRQGACEDFNFIRKLGSDRADQLLEKYCQ